MKELASLGFNDSGACEEALRQSGGEVRGALVLLQRPLLEPFHKRMWDDVPEPAIDINHPDKQVSAHLPQAHVGIRQRPSCLWNVV